MNCLDEILDISGELIVKERYSNRLSGKYKLYRQLDSDVETEVTIAKPDEGTLNSVIWVRTQKNSELPASMMIMYRGIEDVDLHIEAVAGDYLESAIEVRPYNRLFGKYELLEAPRKNAYLPPIADASTRSRIDLRTINYGDTKSMLTGKNDDESFESFVDFGRLVDRIPDIKLIERATLRLYYINFPAGSLIELHQPNTIWRELGITDANKPYSTELLSTDYIVNSTERYIEFDLSSIVNRWQSNDIQNYGLIIKTPENNTLSFFTRESQRPPLLIVKYITSQIYSIGRSQLEGSLFINGKGYKDITGFLTVHSDVGLAYQEASLYVHRIEDPLFYDAQSHIDISRPVVMGQFIVAHRETEELEGLLTIANKTIIEYDSDLNINVPDIPSHLNVDPNAFLYSNIAIARNENNNVESEIILSHPDISAFLQISNYKRTENNLEFSLTVKNTRDDSNDSDVMVSVPDLWSGLTIRALGEDFLESTFEIPFYSSKETDIVINTPDLPASMLIKYTNQVDGEILIKERDFLDSLIDIKQINEFSGFLIAKQKEEKEADFVVNVPDLYSSIVPRVIGQKDLDVIASIRKRDVSDLNSYFTIRGKSNGSYWFIY